MSGSPATAMQQNTAGAMPPSAINLYLDLLKDVLTNRIYGRYEYMQLLHGTSSRRHGLGRVLQAVIGLYKLLWRDKTVRGVPLISRPYDPNLRDNGLDWPAFGFTMVGRKRLDQLQGCLEAIERDGIEGDLLEAGIWRGGVCIFMKAFLSANGVTNRRIWALDSFEGLPKPNPDFPSDAGDMHHKFDELRVSLDQVKDNFRTFGLLDDKVTFVKGFFSDTAATVPVEKLAILRLDGDMYESTIVILKNFYSKVAKGGFIIVDDYGLPNCKAAIEDFTKANNIKPNIVSVDAAKAVYWRKEE